MRMTQRLAVGLLVIGLVAGSTEETRKARAMTPSSTIGCTVAEGLSIPLSLSSQLCEEVRALLARQAPQGGVGLSLEITAGSAYALRGRITRSATGQAPLVSTEIGSAMAGRVIDRAFIRDLAARIVAQAAQDFGW